MSAVAGRGLSFYVVDFDCSSLHVTALACVLHFSDKNVLYNPVDFLLANGIEPNSHVMSQNLTAFDWLLTDKPQYFGLISGWGNPTGVVLLIVLLIMFICSMHWVRKDGYFEVKHHFSLVHAQVSFFFYHK